MVTEKVYKIFLGRLEEATAMYERHRNEAWEEQIKNNQRKLLEIFQDQQKEIERLKKRTDYLEGELRGLGYGDTDLDNDFLWEFQDQQGK